MKTIECFGKVAPHCDWRLEIYGDGTEFEDLKRSAKNSVYVDRIEFGGWVAIRAACLRRLVSLS